MSEAPTDPGAPRPDKDALIADLRRQLGAAQSEIRVLRRRLGAATPVEIPQAQGGLLNELREAAPRKVEAPVSVAVKLGRRFDLWRSPVLVGLVMLLLTGFAIDAGVGLYQARALREARQARLLLENTAMRSLYVELKGISYEPDGKSYRMTLFLQNVSPKGPLYVMLNAVAVYVQAGMVWQQVPSRPAEGVSWGVVKVVDGYTFDVLFTPDVQNWAELIPGYMHVRIQSDLLVSEKAEPGNDVVERRTPYYVYLKPHGASDEEIKARSKSTRTPPIFIPMPPH